MNPISLSNLGMCVIVYLTKQIQSTYLFFSLQCAGASPLACAGQGLHWTPLHLFEVFVDKKGDEKRMKRWKKSSSCIATGYYTCWQLS